MYVKRMSLTNTVNHRVPLLKKYIYVFNILYTFFFFIFTRLRNSVVYSSIPLPYLFLRYTDFPLVDSLLASVLTCLACTMGAFLAYVLDVHHKCGNIEALFCNGILHLSDSSSPLLLREVEMRGIFSFTKGSAAAHRSK